MNDVDAIFNAAMQATRLIHLHNAVLEKQADIYRIKRKTCGHCDHWMKTSCIPEKKHKQFKFCNSSGCKDFCRAKIYTDLIGKYEAEYFELTKKYKKAGV